MTPEQFIEKWAKIQIRESQAAQTHFNDVCALVGHPDPIEFGQPHLFSFEMHAAKTSGGIGRADAFYEGRFIWEYKGPHANLDKAYQQLLLYRESLGNPPLLIVSDTQQIILHTNFTNTPKQRYVISFERLLEDGLDLLKRVFHDPLPLEFFRPPLTKQQITQATADTFVGVTGVLQSWARYVGQDVPRERMAHFTTRLLFCLFAEDMGLLPQSIFSQLVAHTYASSEQFSAALRGLFVTMREGGLYGFTSIPHFDGGLFDDDFVPPNLPTDLSETLVNAARQDWSAIDPSIFGTLFERVIDETKRSQLGAHYTGFEDIMLLVEPILIEPYRAQWDEVKRQVRQAIRKGETDEAGARLRQFADELAAVRVLDPACGSGNFLYVALQQLLSLQKEVINFAARHDLPPLPLTVNPQQLYGLERNLHAHELAQVTVWIGYIQWRFENGFGEIEQPILRPLNNIRRMDAILAHDADGQPQDPTWPPADIIIGNPPFLGGNRIRQELGDEYVEQLFTLYKGKLPAFCDLVCYWFERARALLETGQARRVGLLATNSIRGGVNRTVLARIKQTGDIFMAWSDRAWLLEGASVRISVVGFDNGQQQTRTLNGQRVLFINPDLSNGQLDVTQAKPLPENKEIVFGGTKKGGKFDIPTSLARQFLRLDNNPNGRPNSDVVKPWVNGSALLGKATKHEWVIDFGVSMSEGEASQYVAPFAYVKQHVYPVRVNNRAAHRRTYWWRHSFTAPAMRRAIQGLSRYIATPRVSKYRLFVWLSTETIPDDGTYIFARDDDYFFGMLHSKLHEMWSLKLGTWLGQGNDPRYTPTSTFETFPFPWPPGQEPSESADGRVHAIAEAARAIVAFRQAWLNPTDGGVTIGEQTLKKRTLTNLYNALQDYRENIRPKPLGYLKWGNGSNGLITLAEIEELHDLHVELDQAVLTAYGWSTDLADEQILAQLLNLNLERV